MTPEEFRKMNLLRHLYGCQYHVQQLAHMHMADKELRNWAQKLDQELMARTGPLCREILEGIKP